MLTILRRFLASFVLLILASLATAQDEPALPNGGFESGAGDRPSAWQEQTWGGRAEFAWVEGGRGGGRCLSVASEAGADASWFAIAPVRAFSRYRLSGWIRTEGVTTADGGRGALLNLHDIQPLATKAVTGDADWTRVEVVFETEVRDSVQINCLFGGWGLARGRAWFDDLALELLETTTPDRRVRIDASRTSEPISPYVYGQFIEHMGRCIQGGIWAEMLEDRKFFHAIGADGSPWRAVGVSTVAMSRESPFAGDHDPVVQASAGPSGLAQGGISLVEGRRYRVRVRVEAPKEIPELELRLVWGEGEQGCAVKRFPAQAGGWPAVECEFVAGVSTDAARFEIVSPEGRGFRVGAASLMPGDAIHGMRADVFSLLRELDAPIYRWPGGNFVSGYDWRDGIGERDRRPPRKNPAWTGIESNDFGLDEFMTFCRLLDTEPYVVVNTGLGEVESALAELAYANAPTDTPEGARRAANGHPEPYGVVWWGVGNEMFGNWQLGHMPLDDYVKKHRRFATAMRAADPKIRLIGVGDVGRWTETMLREAGGDMDLISEHFYNQERRNVAVHALQIPASIRRIAAAHRAYRETIPGLAAQDVRIALDEWNFWYGPHVYGELGTRYFLKDALGIAAGLNELSRQSDLYFMANYAQTVNVIGAIKTSPTAASFATTGLVLKLYRQHFGTVPVAVEAAAPLDVAAALDDEGRVLTLAFVNPTAERRSTPIELAGVRLTGIGRRWRIGGEDPMAFNEPGRDPAISIVEDRILGFGEEVELDPYSVTLYRLDVDAFVAVEAPTPILGANLATVAKPFTSHVSGDTSLAALNDDAAPRSSDDASRGSYGNWPHRGTEWVEYRWDREIATNAIEVYWWNDHRGVRTPAACRLLWWDGETYRPVTRARGLGLALDRFNATTFDEVRTTRLRLEIDSDAEFSTGILEWRVRDAGTSPDFPPRVEAGEDRVVVGEGRTYLTGRVKVFLRAKAEPVRTTWSAVSGGDVEFADAGAEETTATFARPGVYILRFEARRNGLVSSDTLTVTVRPAPTAPALESLSPQRWRLDDPLWSDRARVIITRWLPHCIARIEDPDVAEGGLDNIDAAARKLAGKDAPRHKGYSFSNAWVLNTVEAICVALMTEMEDDAEVIAARNKLQETLDDWIPRILAAQEKDGYFQTAFTLSGHRRWSPEYRGDHEGYVAGYFLEAAIAHHALTGGRDRRLYDAARRLADCWRSNLLDQDRDWFDGHQGMELALFRFARLVDEVEGPGSGDGYRELSRSLLDHRDGGGEYDQSHLPVVRQYEAVGHAVRAVYTYAAMADVAATTGDADYRSAVASLEADLVERKFYVTGGVGSGETSEGFGPAYSLPHHGYCESCSSCGMLFLEHRLALSNRDAHHADIYEDTLYNALLGSLDLAGENFFYDNPLTGGRARYPWHVCPCCVGNIPRTLLMLPTWTYARAPGELYVNLFVGSEVTIEGVAPVPVTVVQKSRYLEEGVVRFEIGAERACDFRLHVRVPTRGASPLYSVEPELEGVRFLRINDEHVVWSVEDGYVVIDRRWEPGDRVELTFPMAVQRVRAAPEVAAARDEVALRYGPFVLAVESVDQKLGGSLSPEAPLRSTWWPGRLGGTVVVEGAWEDGSDLVAIPYWLRANRGPSRFSVWINER